jgi:ABC-type branched-subunit amino acid transport system substrate-binding protein
VGVITNSAAAAKANADNVKIGVEYAGGEVVANQEAADTLPDFSAPISALIDAGAECIASVHVPAVMVKMVQAIKASEKPDTVLGTNIGSLPLAVVEPMGADANGIVVTSSAYTTDSPEAEQFRTELAAENPDAAPAGFALTSWAGMYAFAEVAKAIDGPVTSESIINQLGQTTSLSVPGYPKPIDFSKPGPRSSSPSIRNTFNLAYEVQDGAYVLLDPEPIDTADALASA